MTDEREALRRAVEVLSGRYFGEDGLPLHGFDQDEYFSELRGLLERHPSAWAAITEGAEGLLKRYEAAGLPPEPRDVFQALLSIINPRN